ncbi:patatin-like phospholipase family protein [Microvirga lenta]|uniref:patatin-like phospholipase family protein n=1 Tax=Microvirga lenta TaxID=2881337 RepID=UPI001CFC80CF|nr:patatin-like phospholipase family protein [Microvirga lenta]MCB5173959.1 patatin-like phospholipase family protein [Microvirga lenta]
MTVLDPAGLSCGAPAGYPRAMRHDAAVRNKAARPRRISLALQGGGAFGAFTWGVLDRLLEAKVPLDSVSGASAGAMNAVLLASGLAQGGEDGARAALERFWRRVSEAGGRSRLFSPLLSQVASQLSPYQFNPFDLNPLRDILTSEVDIEAVRAGAHVRLLLGATRVRDGALRIFRNKDLTYDVVLASACLPQLHQAVSIDGEPHWDGGYAANPPLMPVVTATRASDLMVVQIIPAHHAELPTTSPEIQKRLSQITFNSSLQRDMDALSLMTQLCQEGDMQNSRLGRKLRRLTLHRLVAEDHVGGLSQFSFLNTEWAHLQRLRDHGRAAVETWLAGRSVPTGPQA